LWEYIKKTAQAEQTTIVLTTHYMEEAEKVCDRVGIIDHGRIIALDMPEKLKETMGGEMIVVRAEKQPLDKILALPYVSEIRENDGALEIITKEAHRHLPKILSLMKDIHCVEMRVPTLNDVFIKLTGRDIRDDTVDDSGSWVDSVARYRQRGS